VQDFLRIDERRIDGVGVEPDIWIVPTLEDIRAGRDPALERALEEIGASNRESPPRAVTIYPALRAAAPA
jgi:C-terminal processing protease CtpA/Prc